MERGFSTAVAGMQKAVAERPQTSIETVQERLGALSDVLNKHAARLEQMANRAIGSAPEKDGSAKPLAVPNGAIGLVNEKIDALLNLTDYLNHQIDRLETVI